MQTKFLLVIIIVFFFIPFANAQDNYYNNKFTYKVKHQLDRSENPVIIKENMLLLTGNNKSMYISPVKVKIDSARAVIKKNRKSIYELRNLKNKLPKNSIKKVFEKEVSSTTIRETVVYKNVEFYYDVPKPSFQWKIKTEEKKILNYNCQKAILNYKGRDYIAWFTDEIALQEGPWKFSGLPGLIMEIYDTKKQFTFKLIGVKKENKPFPKSGLKKYKTTENGVVDAIDNFLKSMESRLLGASKERFRKKRLSIKNENKKGNTNPIELEN